MHATDRMNQGRHMGVTDAIYGRRAIRDYTSTQVDANWVNRLVEAAIQAPSAVNRQPWSFAVVFRRDLLDSISKQAKHHLLCMHVPDPVVKEHRARLEDPAFNLFYNAPALMVVCATSTEQQAAEDCALAAQNFMLAAHADGLGTCWIGFARPWLNAPDGKRMLGIPSDYAPVAPIIFGHPATAAARTPRRPAETLWVGA